MKAQKLNGDFTIGVFSSSSPVSATVPVRYNRGKEYLISKGIRIVDGSLFGKQDFYRSGGIRERADEFNQLLYREDVQVLMASIGGNNTNSILPYIDYEYLKHHPKIIIGYSDTTALLLAVYAKTGLSLSTVLRLRPPLGNFRRLWSKPSRPSRRFSWMACHCPTPIPCRLYGRTNGSTGANRTGEKRNTPIAGSAWFPAFAEAD